MRRAAVLGLTIAVACFGEAPAIAPPGDDSPTPTGSTDPGTSTGAPSTSGESGPADTSAASADTSSSATDSTGGPTQSCGGEELFMFPTVGRGVRFADVTADGASVLVLGTVDSMAAGNGSRLFGRPAVWRVAVESQSVDETFELGPEVFVESVAFAHGAPGSRISLHNGDPAVPSSRVVVLDDPMDGLFELTTDWPDNSGGVRRVVDVASTPGGNVLAAVTSFTANVASWETRGSKDGLMWVTGLELPGDDTTGFQGRAVAFVLDEPSLAAGVLAPAGGGPTTALLHAITPDLGDPIVSWEEGAIHAIAVSALGVAVGGAVEGGMGRIAVRSGTASDEFASVDLASPIVDLEIVGDVIVALGEGKGGYSLLACNANELSSCAEGSVVGSFPADVRQGARIFLEPAIPPRIWVAATAPGGAGVLGRLSCSLVD